MEHVVRNWVIHLFKTGTPPDVSDLYFLFDTLGADVETSIGIQGATPLMHVADVGWIDGVRILLYEFNANINAQDSCGLSALNYALTTERPPSLPIVELLLSHPDVNIHLRGRRFQKHPLYYACLSGVEAFVHLLLPMITEKEILIQTLDKTNAFYSEHIQKNRTLIQKALTAMQKRPRPDDL